MVGAGRFELPTPTTPLWCATRLRYAPTDKTVLTSARGSNRMNCAAVARPIRRLEAFRMIRPKAGS